MKSNNKKTAITFIIVFTCISMYVTEKYIKPEYMLKSIYKIILFAAIPYIYCRYNKISFKEIFTLREKRQIFISAALGIGVYFFILAGYYILKQFIDLNNIALQLQKNLNINKDNFVFVAIYISFVNSMLEELFFRGFSVLILNKNASRLYSYGLSAAFFSVYHVSILANWFNIVIYIVFIAGLFIAGLFFIWLNEKYKNIYNSWIVHMCANFAINSIGFIMFGII